MEQEHRRAERRAVKVKALVAIGDDGPIDARTIDVSAQGVALVLPQPARPGSRAQVEFTIFFDGKSLLVRAIARLAYCIFSNGEFRAGFEFIYIEPDTLKAITQFVRIGT